MIHEAFGGAGMKHIAYLQQRAHGLREEIRRITFQSQGPGKALPNDQWNRVKYLETALHAIEWELVGAMSARLAASSLDAPPE